MGLHRGRVATAGLAVLVGLAVWLTACGDDDAVAPAAARADVTGQQLAEKYMRLLQQKDTEQLDSFLSEAFIVARADGSTATKEQYLKDFPDLRSYIVRGVTARQDGPVLTVKWELVTDETVNGQTYRRDPAPRLSTFLWDGDEWRLVSHANFNTPAAAPTPASGR